VIIYFDELVTTHGVRVVHWIYWTLATRNYKHLQESLWFTLQHAWRLLSAHMLLGNGCQKCKSGVSNRRIRTPTRDSLLDWLLHGDGPGIVDTETCFNCRGNVFTSRCLAMDDFSGTAVQAFSHHVTLFLKIWNFWKYYLSWSDAMYFSLQLPKCLWNIGKPTFLPNYMPSHSRNSILHNLYHENNKAHIKLLLK
jgi:hypothetical protein